MKNDIIKEIWEIRGLLDIAIDNQDIDLYTKARDRFNKIFKLEKHLLTFSTSTIDYEPVDIEDMRKDREQNFAVIGFDLGNNLRRVYGEEFDIEKFQFSSVLEVIWWSRWMFDNFVKNKEMNDVKDEVNMRIYKAVETNLRETINFYENFDDETSQKELESLIDISMEVASKHEELYCGDDNNIN